MRTVVEVSVDRGRRSKTATVALAEGRSLQGSFAVGHGMDDALAVDRALRGVDVSWSVGMMMAIGVVVRGVFVGVVDLLLLYFGGGHGGGSVRVARVDVRRLFQVVLSSSNVVFLQFLLVLVQLGLVVGVCSDTAATAAAVAVAVADGDGDVVDG